MAEWESGFLFPDLMAFFTGLRTITGERLPAIREALSEGNKWATRAPLIIVMATKPSLDARLEAGRDYAYYDLGMAALALMLQATREGLYAHPIAGYTPSKVAKAAGLPEDFVPLNLIIVGRPGDDALLNEGQRLREHAPRQRKGLEEIAFDDSWEKAWGTGDLADVLDRQGLPQP